MHDLATGMITRCATADETEVALVVILSRFRNGVGLDVDHMLAEIPDKLKQQLEEAGVSPEGLQEVKDFAQQEMETIQRVGDRAKTFMSGNSVHSPRTRIR